MNPELEREKTMNYYLSKRKRGKTAKWYVYFFEGQEILIITVPLVYK